jgi:hypothetical protein
VTDGPYAETKKSCFVLHRRRRGVDAATAWAAKMPAAEYGSIELGPMTGFELA